MGAAPCWTSYTMVDSTSDGRSKGLLMVLLVMLATLVAGVLPM